MFQKLKLFIVSLSLVMFASAGVSAADRQDASSDTPKGVLAGQFMEKGKVPLANGKVFIYDKAMGPPSADKHVRVPDYITDLDQKGKFSQVLPAGTYFFTARKKADVASVGPPAEGQLIYYRMDSNKKIQPFVVSAGKTTNAGVISSSVPRKRHQDSHETGLTLIEGVVIDSDGVPVEGAVIFVYVNPEILNKAYHVSEKTGKDGVFLLRVNDAGDYYLRVRGAYGGGIPKEGEIVNIHDPKELTAVTVKKGEKLSGVTIQVKRQAARGPLFQGNQ